MTTVVILPELGNRKRFRAVAGERESFGSTMGEALDALSEDLPESEDRAVVLVQDFQPDEFFNEDQQRRLSFLMSRWRSARDLGEGFPASEQEELEELIGIELEASGKRSQRLAEQMNR